MSRMDKCAGHGRCETATRKSLDREREKERKRLALEIGSQPNVFFYRREELYHEIVGSGQ